MKLLATIKESPRPEDNFIVVQFSADKSRQLFQVFIENPYRKKIRLFDEWLLDIKFRSIVMQDLEGKSTYDTQLYTETALEATENMRRKYK